MLLESLVDLDLSDNLIGDFPPHILKHKTLTKLNLENNRITVVPITAEQLKDNFDLRLKGNPGYSSFLKIKKTAQDGEISPRNIGESDGTPREIPVFGIKLDELITYEKKAYPDMNVIIPIFVRVAINQILSSSLEQQGLFRLEGNSAQMQEYKEEFNTSKLKNPPN